MDIEIDIKLLTTGYSEATVVNVISISILYLLFYLRLCNSYNYS